MDSAAALHDETAALGVHVSELRNFRGSSQDELRTTRRLLETENATLREALRSSDLDRARLTGKMEALQLDVSNAKAEVRYSRTMFCFHLYCYVTRSFVSKVWNTHEQLVAARTMFETKLERHLADACVKVRHLRQTRRACREELALTQARAKAEVTFLRPMEVSERLI